MKAYFFYLTFLLNGKVTFFIHSEVIFYKKDYFYIMNINNYSILFFTYQMLPFQINVIFYLNAFVFIENLKNQINVAVFNHNCYNYLWLIRSFSSNYR